MKKRVQEKETSRLYLKNYSLMIGVILLAVIAVILVKSLTGNVIDPLNTQDPLGIGLNPENAVTKTPEQLANDSANYLQKEWMNLKKNSVVLGPIFKVLDPVLRTFCGYEFSFKLEFFVAFFLALFIFFIFTNGINAFYQNYLISLAIGLLVTIIAVAGGLMKIVMPKIMPILNNPWIISGFFAIVVLLIVLSEYIKRYIKEEKKQKALGNLGDSEDKLNSAADKLEGTMKGIEAVKDGYENAGSGI